MSDVQLQGARRLAARCLAAAFRVAGLGASPRHGPVLAVPLVVVALVVAALLAATAAAQASDAPAADAAKPAPPTKAALLAAASPAAKALCARLEGEAVEWCVQGCKWPVETACLMVRRWGPLGINVAVHARNNKLDVREVAKQAGMDPEQGRLLRLYADHEAIAKVDWNPVKALSDAQQARLKAAQELTVAGVKAFRERDLTVAMAHLQAARESLVVVLGAQHVEVAHAAVRLGHVLLAKGDGDAAAVAFEDALKTFAAVMDPDHPAIADAEVMKAQALEKLLRSAQARPLLESALRKRTLTHGDDDPGVATTLNNLAHIYGAVGDFGRQRAALERSLAIRRVTAGPEAEQTATECSNLGTFLIEQGRSAEARTLLEEALKIRRRPGMKARDLAISLNNLAGLEKSVGNLGAARALLESALAAWDRDPRTDSLERAVTMQMLGMVLFDSGDLQAGLVLMKQVETLREQLPPHHPARILSLRTLGSYQLEAAALMPPGPDRSRNEAEARVRIERALAATRALRGDDHPDTAEMLLITAGMIQQVEGALASLPVFHKAEAALRRHYPVGHRLTIVASANYAGALLAVGRPAEALTRYQAALVLALDTLGAWHPTTRRLRNQLLRTRAALGQDVELTNDLEDIVNSLGDRVAAAATAAASDIELLFLASSLDHERKTVLQRFGGAIPAAKLFGWTLRLTGTAQQAEVVWRAVGRAGAARGEALRAALEERREAARTLLALDAAAGSVQIAAGQRREARAAALAQAADVQRRLVALAPELADLPKLLRPDLPSICATLRRDRAALVHYVDAKLLPKAAAKGAPTAPAPVPPMPAGERSDGRVLHYGAFVVTPSCKVHAVVLPPAREVDARVAAFREAIAATTACYSKRRKMQFCGHEAKVLDEAGAALRAMVWRPLEPHLGTTEPVWIAPTEGLNAVAFDALPGKDGRYLVHERAIGYVTHPAALIASRAERPQGRGALVVGDVDYDSAAVDRSAALAAWQRCGAGGCDAGVAPERELLVLADTDGASRAAATVCGQDARWSALPPTEAEGVALLLGKRLGEAALARGAAATEAAIAAALGGRRVLHLASHGYFAPLAACVDTKLSEAQLEKLRQQGSDEIRAAPLLDPMRLSALVLSGRNPRFGQADVPASDDGLLTARDIARVDLRATDLAVLSACETGLGENANADGPVGLVRALLIGGAGTVVASLWQVPSKETGELFAAFYARIDAALAAGAPPADATPATGGKAVKRGRAVATSAGAAPAALPSMAVVNALRAARLELIDALAKRGVQRSAFLWGAFIPVAGRP